MESLVDDSVLGLRCILEHFVDRHFDRFSDLAQSIRRILSVVLSKTRFIVIRKVFMSRNSQVFNQEIVGSKSSAHALRVCKVEVRSVIT